MGRTMKNPIKVISLSVFIIAVAACAVFIQKQLAASGFKKETSRRWEEIDHFMKYSENSPFKDKSKEKFTGLKYFPPDPKYKVKATIVPIHGSEMIAIPMNDGSTEDYYRYGFAEFILKNKPHRLLLLKAVSDRYTDRLFLAFSDGTSGRVTYGGGRYIDLYQEAEDWVMIDFNMAYNPYCVYNISYICPLPPAENHMQVDVRAGEKIYLHE
ncbi:MAG TPA: DUF1684 domain-containing protein [Spirochaetes bacterium]|nr:DUF1684 domain-containing protein [Spirochaetota bacterium]